MFSAQIRWSLLVAAAASILFCLPPLLLLHHLGGTAPFYFFAEDSFYYLSVALHSAHTPFFTLDGLHPTNGFHPLWEWLLFGLSHLHYFRLDGFRLLSRLFALDLAIVAAGVALLSAWIHRLTRRPILAIVAVTPGLFWLVAGIGSPSFSSSWANLNGMETGLEVFFLSAAALLFGRSFCRGPRLLFACFALGLAILARLDDVFFCSRRCCLAQYAPHDQNG